MFTEKNTLSMLKDAPKIKLMDKLFTSESTHPTLKSLKLKWINLEKLSWTEKTAPKLDNPKENPQLYMTTWPELTKH